jgi:hypothetical protein
MLTHLCHFTETQQARNSDAPSSRLHIFSCSSVGNASNISCRRSESKAMATFEHNLSSHQQTASEHTTNCMYDVHLTCVLDPNRAFTYTSVVSLLSLFVYVRPHISLDRMTKQLKVGNYRIRNSYGLNDPRFDSRKGATESSNSTDSQATFRCPPGPLFSRLWE